MLTHRQKECLTFIEGYISQTGGVSPAFDEIAAGIGLSRSAKASVCRVVAELSEMGYIRHLPHKSRSIEVLIRQMPAKEKAVPFLDLSKGQSYFLYDRESETMLPWTPP